MSSPTDTTAWQPRIVGLASGDAEFAEYVAARQAGLLRFAYLLTGDRHAAEDLVQTTLAKTFLRWHRLRDTAALDAYVKRAIVNEHRSLWRRAWKRNEWPRADLPDRGAPTPARDLEIRDALWRMVLTLPVRQRATLVLRYFEDLSEVETAEVLGVSVGTVKSQSSRALAALRSRVAADPGLVGGEPDD